jgi:putative transposase
VPRPRRSQEPGAILHVVARGAAQSAVFHDDLDRRRFLRLLGESVVACRWRCLTYCLMGNHYHLVVKLEVPNLSTGMHRLGGTYARWFNYRHERSGHVFESRFWSRAVREEGHLIALARYIALNPVRANLCAAAEDWRWGAHRALVGLEPSSLIDVEGLLEHLDRDLDRARHRYACLVNGLDPARPTTDVRLLETLAWPDASRAAVHARQLGYGVSQIASTLRCSERTVERHLAAARQRGLAPLSST